MNATNSSTHLDMEAEIKAAFDTWNDAWNRGDLGGYLDAYWDSPETRYVSESLKSVPFADGIVVLGRQNIDKVFTDVFVRSKTFLANQSNRQGVAGLLSLPKLQVTAAGSTDAVVFGEFKIDMTTTTSRAGLITIHLRKEGGRWAIISEHTTSLHNAVERPETKWQCDIL
jgi:ketosteroid isomerase-like protein